MHRRSGSRKRPWRNTVLNSWRRKGKEGNRRSLQGRKRKDYLSKEEMKAEIQKLKVGKEEAQRKAQKELEVVKKVGEESAAQVEKKRKRQSRERDS